MAVSFLFNEYDARVVRIVQEEALSLGLRLTEIELPMEDDPDDPTKPDDLGAYMALHFSINGIGIRFGRKQRFQSMTDDQLRAMIHSYLCDIRDSPLNATH